MASTQLTIPSWIGGKEYTAESTFDVSSPSSGSVCWKVSSASRDDALRAVESAHAAFPAWRETKPAARQAILTKAADLMEERADELAGYLQTEIGVDLGTARYLFVKLAIDLLRDIAGRAPTICGKVPAVASPGRSAMVWKQPYGVMLGITPWNAPYIFGVRSVASALVTGNTTVLKGSELSPRCFWALGKVFHDAGVPDGVVNVISSQPKDAPTVVNAMLEHQAVKKVNFTGSTNTGRLIAQTAAKNLKPCLMELGGKNCALVLPDADLANAAGHCVTGAFANAGQICMSTDLMLIHKDVAEEFLDVLKQKLTARLGKVDSGDNKGLPFAVSASAAARIQNVVKDAQKKGAEIFFGGETPADSQSAQVRPTVFGKVTSDMSLIKEEAFGPLMGYEIVTDEDAGIRRMNSFQYGLSAAVFTKDLRRAFAIARQIESGAVHINSMTVHDEPTLPFGGWNNSGWGRFNADEGLEEFLQTKSVVWDD